MAGPRQRTTGVDWVHRPGRRSTRWLLAGAAVAFVVVLIDALRSSQVPAGVAFADELTDWAWVTQAGDEWLAGLGSRVRLRLSLDDGHALADWGQVGLIRRAGDGLRAGVVDWTAATVRDSSVPFVSATTSARAARDGDRLVIHGGADGLDEGVAVLDPATGRLEQLVAPGPLADGFVRNLIFWSPWTSIRRSRRRSSRRSTVSSWSWTPRRRVATLRVEPPGDRSAPRVVGSRPRHGSAGRWPRPAHRRVG